MGGEWRFLWFLETERYLVVLAILLTPSSIWMGKWGGKGLVKALDRRADFLNTFNALLIESSGGAGPVKLRQPDPIFGWGC